MLRAFFAVVLLSLSTVPAKAQDSFWVQIEARQTLTEATERAREYARRFSDVQGYYLGTGFYGIVLGPYSEQLARQELSRLLASRQIPSDSYLQNGRRFEQQFWPIGGSANVTPNEIAQDEIAFVSPALPDIPLTGPQETVAEARAAEAALSPEARQELQKALQWAGFYNAAIDGAFGRGTRSAMEDWQIANNQDPTGVLTTSQRALLLGQYNFDLESAGMQMVRDDATGIAMQIPLAMVTFAEFQPPFAQYTASGDLPQARVLLISQPGDAGRLAGLFEVMQVLDIVPPEGARRLSDNAFVIEGADNDIQSYTTASLVDGEIKGFTLVWPQGDSRRFARVLDAMQSSFARIDGVLDPNIVPPSADQTIDMISGLSVRQPQLSRSGFYVSGEGHVVTTSEVLQSCERLTFDRDTEAEVLVTVPELGLAILRPTSPVTPIDILQFQDGTPRLQDPIALAGYPFDGVLPAPTLTFGTLIDLRDLSNDARFKRLSVLARPSNAGGAVLAESGAVLGMLLPRQGATSQALPPEVQFSLNAADIVALLTQAGVAVSVADPAPAIGPVALQRKATDAAVLVSCW